MTDVLVVGGGAAGLCAAIAARRAGANTLLVSKTPVGLANCSAYAGGGFTLATGGMTPGEHRELTFATGRELNDPSLLEVLVHEAPRLVEVLAGMGVRFRERRGGISTAPYARHPLMGGEVLTRALRDYAVGLGVELRSGLVVTHVLTAGGHAAGVEALDLASGRACALGAGAVVLATGGGGRAYGRTDNPVRTTGDGYRLLYELGLPLEDMEFVQFYPLGLDEPGCVRWMLGLHLIDEVPLTNSRGERFLDPLLAAWGLKNGAEANLYARDRAAVAVAAEYRAGREVYLHLDRVPPERWQERRFRFLARLYPRGRRPWEGPVRVTPIQHYCVGGIRTDTSGGTGLPGLLAAGEVTAGVDGANRVGGNALTSCVVFGFRAGERAAAEAQLPAALPEPARTGAECRRWAGNLDGPEPAAVAEQIRHITDGTLGPIRTAAGLDAAESQLRQVDGLLPAMKAAGPRALAAAYETVSLWQTAALVCAGARARTESRGVHYRSDYPAEDPAWRRHVRLVDGAGWPMVVG